MEQERGERSLGSKVIGHHTVLLVALLGAFAVSPVVGEVSWGRPLLNFVLMAVMAAALLAVWKQHKIALVAALLGGSFVVVLALTHLLGIHVSRTVIAAIEFTFLAIVAVSIFSDVLRRRRVTMDTVFGACCVYLMLGLAWGGLYEIIEFTSPGSFELGDLSSAESGGFIDEESASRLFYFSFVTMTTVGYGDITPVSAPARGLAMLQGLVGQFYIAIVVARLVAMEISDRMRRGD